MNVRNAATPPTTRHPIPQGAGRRRWGTLWIAAFAMLAGVILVMFISAGIWFYLAVSIMPRPWDSHNEPLPPLHVAVESGDIVSTQLLLDAGEAVDLQAYKNSQWPDGVTPLMIAVAEDHVEIARLLLERGAAVDATIANGRTAPIHFASARSIQLLKDYGADMNVRDEFGRTPLMTAAIGANRTHDLRVVQRLIEAGADPHVRDIYGRNAIEIVQTWPNPHPALIDLLEKAVADHNHTRLDN